jgi:hypothetical protein
MRHRNKIAAEDKKIERMIAQKEFKKYNTKPAKTPVLCFLLFISKPENPAGGQKFSRMPERRIWERYDTFIAYACNFAGTLAYDFSPPAFLLFCPSAGFSSNMYHAVVIINIRSAH